MIRCDKFGLFEPVQKDDGKMVCALPEGEFPEPYGLTAGKRDCIGKSENLRLKFWLLIFSLSSHKPPKT